MAGGWQCAIAGIVALPLAPAIGTVGAQQWALSPIVSARARPDSVRRVQIPRVSGDVKTDGVLDEPIWQKAARLTGFAEVEPSPGAVPKDSTIGLIAYDQNYLYVAVLAYGSESNIRAPVTTRDDKKIGNGYDGITLRLDTFNDARNAYVIQVNPRGVQFDRSMREGDVFAGTYEDFVWKSGARVSANVYTVEIAIPFTSVRFPSLDAFDIGFNIIRDYGAVGHQDSWAPRVRGSPCDICQEGILEGISGVSTRQVVDIRPYIMAANNGSRALTVGTARDREGVEWPAVLPGEWRSDAKERRIGGDLAIAITPSYVVNATIHPDFSQIEAAPEQVRVNQRFAVYYPDLRPFFTTGSDAFNTAGSASYALSNAQLFYTRDVNDPSVGARLTGRTGGLLVAGLFAHDQHPLYYHYSGYESGGSDDPLIGPANLGVLRVRQDVSADSYIGLLVTDREQSDATNRVVSADTRMRLGQFTFNFEAAQSDDRLPLIAVPKDSSGQCPPGYTASNTVTSSCLNSLYDGSGRSGTLLRGQIGYTDPHVSATVSSGRVSSDFRAQLGNMRRVGIEQHNLNLYVTQYLKRRGWRQVQEMVEASVSNKDRGGLLDYSVMPKVIMQFSGTTSIALFTNLQRTTFLGQSLEYRTDYISTNLGLRKTLDVGLLYNTGRRPIYDFANPRLGDGHMYQVTMSMYPIPAMTLAPVFSRTVVTERYGGEKIVDAKLFYMTASYQYTPALGIRAMLQLSEQWSGILENPFLQQDAYTQSSVVLKYEIAATSFVYCGINNEHRRFLAPIVPENRYLQTGARVYFKMSYLVRI
jgi:hypothetical protein